MSLPLIHHTRPALGLVVLRVDETIEEEFRTLVPSQAARLHVTRIASGDTLTPESIGEMKSHLTEAARLLPPAAGFDVVAYACTSASALLGADTVAQHIRAGVNTHHVTNPLRAALARMASLGIARVGVVSPYTDAVAKPLVVAFETGGVEVVATESWRENDEATVARIDPEATADAARALVKQAKMDAVFLSCTNLRTSDILSPLSDELGVPVLSSNAALAWHMKELAGVPEM